MDLDPVFDVWIDRHQGVRIPLLGFYGLALSQRVDMGTGTRLAKMRRLAGLLRGLRGNTIRGRLLRYEGGDVELSEVGAERGPSPF